MKVYNFQVADWHTYYAAPEADKPFVWVHNANYGPKAQKAARKAAKESSHQGQPYRCVECADDVIAGVNKAGYSAHKVTVEYPGGWIYSDSLGRNISDNGRHVGVFVRGPNGGRVYDNFRPNGVPFREWIEDMWNKWPSDMKIKVERIAGGS